MKNKNKKDEPACKTHNQQSSEYLDRRAKYSQVSSHDGQFLSDEYMSKHRSVGASILGFDSH
jgi:hypothetical protein